MKCPGQDSRYWRPGSIFEVKCPQCDSEVEFFKDDTTRICKQCGHKFLNPELDFGCASYCKYAEQCLGNLPPELAAEKENLLKDRVAIEMKRHFSRDFKKIGHAMRVARHAEQLGRSENGDPPVILVAAYLLDIGSQESGRETENPADSGHEKQGPPAARSIMSRLGARDELIEEVCDIIDHHHHPGAEESVNFKIVYDADRLAELEDRQKEQPQDSEAIKAIIEDRFLTDSGKELAKKTLLDRS